MVRNGVAPQNIERPLGPFASLDLDKRSCRRNCYFYPRDSYPGRKPLNRMRVMVLVIAVVNLLSLSATGATIDRWLCGDSQTPSVQLQHDFKGQPESAPATFTIAGLTLNKSTFKDAEARFGPSTPASRSTDIDGFNECYKSARWPHDPTVLILMSGWEGESEELSAFMLKSDSSSQASKCVTSSLVRSDLATGNRLRLGLSQDDLQRILGHGRPGAEGFRRWFYSGEVPVPAADAKVAGTPFYYKDSGVTARFRDSKADCISVFQVESY